MGTAPKDATDHTRAANAPIDLGFDEADFERATTTGDTPVAAVVLGAVVELAFVRRFARASRLVLTVATIGITGCPKDDQTADDAPETEEKVEEKAEEKPAEEAPAEEAPAEEESSDEAPVEEEAPAEEGEEKEKE